METTPIESLLTKPLDQISHDDRLLLLRELVDASAIRHLILPGNEEAPIGAMLLCADDVRAGAVCPVICRTYFPFVATRLFILDTQRTRTDVMTQESVTTTGWLRKKSTRHRFTKEVAVSERVTAEHWSLRSAFAGSRSVFPSGPDVSVSGGAFTLFDSPFAPVLLLPGVDFSIEVSHNLAGLADFRAILFGTPKKS